MVAPPISMPAIGFETGEIGFSAAGDRDRHHAMKESVGKTTSAIHPLDAMAMAPSHHKVLFENELVRVLARKCCRRKRLPSQDFLR